LHNLVSNSTRVALAILTINAIIPANAYVITFPDTSVVFFADLDGGGENRCEKKGEGDEAGEELHDG
jgi:hypothetical protein